MKELFLLGAMLMTSACTPPPDEGPEDIPVRGAGSCDADAAGELIGKPASEALGQRALELSGAAALRWIQPGQMVTMDYREDRLNIELDEANRVKALRCG
ncbi:MAG: I78 family peptidase inhibitor [Sphingomonadaceae bacterium]